MNPLMNLTGKGTAGRGGLSANPQAMQIIASAKRMMGALNAVKDPQTAIQTVAGQNPMLGGVMRLIGGRDPQAVFYEECRKKGVDPDEILSLLK